MNRIQHTPAGWARARALGLKDDGPSRRRGQGLAEYAIILALIAIVAIV
jgi:hypothetical protein